LRSFEGSRHALSKRGGFRDESTFSEKERSVARSPDGQWGRRSDQGGGNDKERKRLQGKKEEDTSSENLREERRQGIIEEVNPTEDRRRKE